VEFPTPGPSILLQLTPLFRGYSSTLQAKATFAIKGFAPSILTRQKFIPLFCHRGPLPGARTTWLDGFME